MPQRMTVDSWKMRMQEAYDTALQQLRQGRLDEAEALCVSILQEPPEHAPTLALLALAKMQRGQPEQALHYVDRALALEPNQADAQTIRGNALHRLGRYADAVQAYQTAQAL